MVDCHILYAIIYHLCLCPLQNDASCSPQYNVKLWLPWWYGWWSVCLQCGKPRLNPWVRKISWRRKWQPTPAFLPGKSMDGGAWRATVHGVTKSRTQLSDFTFLAIKIECIWTRYFPVSKGPVSFSFRTLFSSAVPLLVFTPENWMPMSTQKLTNDCSWRLKCPNVHQLSKMCHISPMQHYSAVKK